MNILYDGRIFQIQRAGGINRYFAEIISRLPADWHPTLIGASDMGENRAVHPNLALRYGPDLKPHRVGRKLRQWRWRTRYMSKPGVFHPTYCELCDGGSFTHARGPVVVTVYDMIFASYPNLIEGSAFIVDRQREAVARADKIVCISKNTERELLEKMPAAAGKTCVIHLASSFSPEDAVASRSSDETARFLYVGARGKYKNFLFLLYAFASACRSCKMRLTVAGPPLNEIEQWQLHLLGISDLVDVHVFPDEAALKRLYHGSVALLYPSQHEGFGIPPLEAMACGTVAVTANTTSLPEVMGDGGIMLDPRKQSDWSECILQLAKGGINRETLVARGYKRVQQFSWEKTAAEHIALYRQLAG